MAFMVVGLHSGFLGDLSKAGHYLTVNGLFRVAVPVFLIINGFYFFEVISKNNQYAWLKRVIILYFLWTFFYSFFWFSTPEWSPIWIINFFHKIFIGYWHLWYIPGMFFAAVILLLFKRANSLFLSVSIALTFLSGVFIQYTGNYHLYAGSYLDILFNYHCSHRNFLFFSYPFLCIGYLINKHSLHNKVTLRSIWLYCFSGISLLIIESYINFHNPFREGGFDNFLSLLLVCPAIFILFMRLEVIGNSKMIALYSSAIYFIHIFVLIFFKKFTDLGNTRQTIAVIIVAGAASFFIIKANKRFKLIL
jgi:hypothetical protein